jgi:hypothetical protein
VKNNKSGARNVYQQGKKWYAKVTKNGKTYTSPLLDHFEQAKAAASELRRELNVTH